MFIQSSQQIIDLIPDLVFCKNLQGKYIQCNKEFLKFLGKEENEVLQKTDFDLFSKTNAQTFRNNDEEIIKALKNKTLEEAFINSNEEIAYFNTTKQLIFNEANEVMGLFCVAKDITRHKEYETFYQDTQVLLEYIATHNELETIFEKIIQVLEQRNPNAQCSIVLLDKEKKHLNESFALNLPQFYLNAIKGLEIGEKLGSCGAAAYKKERVIISNINEHENWQPYLELTQKANLHACWSEPILSSQGEVLGTFAIYNSHPKEPSDFELKHISSFAHLVAVAIEKDNILKMIQEKNSLLMNKSRIASIGEMLENISLHWRQPLSIISTEASGIKLKDEYEQLSKESLNESINNIIKYTHKLSETLDDFKKYAITQNEKEWFYLDDSIEDALFLMQSNLQSKKVMVLKEVENIELFSIENAFIHALLNILRNAFDVLNNDENIIKIQTKQLNKKISIEIWDNGGGIDEKIINKVFDPYFTTKEESIRTGSGLYICKEIIEGQMKGNIRVNNQTLQYNGQDYKGALFTVTLPLG